VIPPRVAAVVLAAGLSSRMPGNKLLANLTGKPVLRHVVEAALASQASPVIVVTGHAAQPVRAALHGLDIAFIENPDFAIGLSESLKCGVRNAGTCDGVLVLLGDMPYVLPSLMNDLIQALDPSNGRSICVPLRNGRRGNPVLFARALFPELLALEGDAGAKRIIARHEDVVCEVAASDDGVLIDIDTQEDLKAHE